MKFTKTLAGFSALLLSNTLQAAPLGGPVVPTKAATEASAEVASTLPEPAGRIQACEVLKPEDNSKLDMIAQVLQDRKSYAAIAFLDAAAIKSPRADLLRANSLRQVGSLVQATALYQQLLGSCVAAYAYQGIGLVLSQQNQHAESAKYLSRAASLAPIDSVIRGDFGYALMKSGNKQRALQEYLTAIELDRNNSLAVNNLLSLMIEQGHYEKARRFSEIYGVDAEQLSRLMPATQKTAAAQMPANNPAQAVAPTRIASLPEKTVQYQNTECQGGTVCTGILSTTLQWSIE
ncbi:tetratricopeptide repeat protein [Pseudomethylobacillus aquaticus]|nr:hypothetical protein [Pseudomethylobacillus aquaticus]